MVGPPETYEGPIHLGLATGTPIADTATALIDDPAGATWIGIGEFAEGPVCAEWDGSVVVTLLQGDRRGQQAKAQLSVNRHGAILLRGRAAFGPAPQPVVAQSP